MTRVERPKNILEVSTDTIAPFEHILLDRDGLLGHYGLPIESSRAEHVNSLILNSPDKRFTIVTNGDGDTEPILAEVIRTTPPLIKQIRPRLFKSLVQEPSRSLLITDSFSETVAAHILGFQVFYVQDKLTPHPYEQILRRTSRPVRIPISKLVGLQTN